MHERLIEDWLDSASERSYRVMRQVSRKRFSSIPLVEEP